MNDKTIENIFKKFKKLPVVWHKCVDESILKPPLKGHYHKLIDKKFEQMEML